MRKYLFLFFILRVNLFCFCDWPLCMSNVCMFYKDTRVILCSWLSVFVPFWSKTVIDSRPSSVFFWILSETEIVLLCFWNIIQGLDFENHKKNIKKSQQLMFSPGSRRDITSCFHVFLFFIFCLSMFRTRGVSNDRFFKNGLKYSQSPVHPCVSSGNITIFCIKNPWISSDIFMDVLYL